MGRNYMARPWKYLLAAAALLCLTGCGGQEPAISSGGSGGFGTESPEGSAQGEKQQVDMEGENSMEHSGEGRPEDGEPSLHPEQEGVLSEERTTAAFDVGSFFELNMVVGGDCVYGLGRRQKGEETILFQVGAEDGIVREFETALEPEISARAACADSSGNLHLLLSDGGNWEWTEILALDRSGQIISRTDLSEVKEETEVSNLSMAIGSDGSYYLSYTHTGGSSILVVDGKGSRKEAYSLDVGLVGLGTGKSGQVYGMVYDRDGQYLAALTEEGEMEPCPNGAFPGMPIVVSCLAPGVQGELLLGNGAYGAWTYEAGRLEQVVLTEEMPYQGQDVEAFGFLGDGRLCMTGYGDGTHTIECLPAERKK